MLDRLNVKSDNKTSDRDRGYVSAPTAVSLPKGGGAIAGIGEKFSMNPAMGTGSVNIPVFVSPGRSGFSPQLALSYDSGSGNSPFGLGWSLVVPSITRKTQKGLPQYQDAENSDIFLLSGAEDLVPKLIGEDRNTDSKIVNVPNDSSFHLSSYPQTGTYNVQRYRPRIEGLFARIERWEYQATGDVHWRSLSKDNITSVYGKNLFSRVVDPKDSARIFQWLLCESYDDKGNVIIYQYKQEDAANVDATLPQEQNRLADGHSYSQQYLKRIFYGNREPFKRDNWLFQVLFDYGEHDAADPNPDLEVQPWLYRQDAFSSFRSSFEIRTQRLCQRVLMFHRFDETGKIDAGDKSWYLVRSTDLGYEHNPVATYLIKATQTGYQWNETTHQYRQRSYPPLEFNYDRPKVQDEIKSIDSESLENLPIGLDGGQYQWLDLDGEGISGILTEQAGGWFYKANLGTAKFSPLQVVATKPSLSDPNNSLQRFMDLAGDGQQDLVLLNREHPGFYERTLDEEWSSFKAFRSIPNVDWNDPNLRTIDLNGDGHADILISEQDVFVWYPSQAESGFGQSERVHKLFDEEKSPAVIFADAEQSVYLADMTGDGLNDLVRIRNGEVCYWANMGYGQFGSKVTMGNAPYFDHPEMFNQRRIRLADLDGSGTTDLVYLGRKQVQIWFNQAGNSWSKENQLQSFPQVDNLTSVQMVDLLGNGTACLVWSSPLPEVSHQRMQYIDLMGGQKPHLLRSMQNNLGAETKLYYAPSTKFYLEDKAAGKPWITKIPFPVQVVERVKTFDRLSGNKFVSSYRYRHGYFDGEEREFRGFGYVEQLDTETFEKFQGDGVSNATDADLHIPPILTKTWFHTGFYRDREHISQLFAEEYYTEDAQAVLLPDTILPSGLSSQEEREACRSLRGQALRQEVYALDESDRAEHPYTVSESNYDIRLVQPLADRRYAVFFTHPRESIAYQYERNPENPRIAHQMTLEVDEFGNVLKSVAIAYPRRNPAYPEQEKTFVTYTENRVTNKPDEDSWYRLGVPIETKTYEITGLPVANLYTIEKIREQVANASSINYEAQPTVGVQKRIIEQVRSLYRPDGEADTTNPTLLGLGEVESLALPGESYKLAFTPGLLNSIYNSKISSGELNNLLSQEGKYVQLEGNWWIPSGRQAFDLTRFFITTETKDPFGEVYRTEYDRYQLLATQTIDPVGNTVTVRNNYRTLQPEEITNPNGNRAQVAFDVLGMVAGTAVMGKVGSAEGDSLDNFKTDLTQQQIDSFSQNLDTAADLLGSATTRIIYDLDRYFSTGEPAFAATLARETHVSDLATGEQSKIQVSFTYSDGFGREIQQKIQAEPGLAPVRDERGVLRCDRNLQPTDPRWVGTGRTIFNNKGKPVKQYEPFFSPTHTYESETDLVECGVTPILHYDPLARVIRTDLPDGSFSKVEFDPWQQSTWDNNDTVLESQWYIDRGSPDPAAPEPSNQTTRAAWLTAQHANTPTVAYLDTLGRPFLTVADNGADETGAEQKYQTRVELDIEGNQRSVTDALERKVMVYDYDLLGNVIHQHSMEAGERWMLNNVAGNPLRAWDSRGHSFRSEYDRLQRPIRSYVKGIDSNPNQEYLTDRLIYGEQHPEDIERNLRGQLYLHLDQAGVVASQGFDFKGNSLSGDRHLAREYKPTIDWSAVDAVIPDDANTKVSLIDLETALSPLLESDTFTSSTTYDALNRPLTMTMPDDSVVRPGYNEANLLERVEVNLQGNTVTTNFVTNIDYDAKGQRTQIEYGNGVKTNYTYDRFTFRLTQLKTLRGTEALQDISYTYDPVGNITHISDQAQQTIYFRNQIVEPSNSYTYDAIYRLVSATGREHLGQTGGQKNAPTPSDAFNDFQTNLPHPGDGNAMGTYAENYLYDAVGNILAMQHRGSNLSNPGWTRNYTYNETSLIEPDKQSNRLSSTRLTGNNTPVKRYLHDAHGNMTRMPHLENHSNPNSPNMHWDYQDQLQHIDLGGGGTAYYVYDASGQRTRKIVEKSPGLTEERIYLGGFEIFRKYNASGVVTLERETLHIMDDQQRIALVETRTIDTANTDPSPAQLIRYQLSNHLGSASVELDNQAQIISYEEYTPYGSSSYQAVRSQTETPKRYRYTGMERDEETGLEYHSARYYLPWLGRWVSADPLGIKDGSNLYYYSHNNPVLLTDRMGTDATFDRMMSQMIAFRNRDPEGFVRFLGRNEVLVYPLLNPFGFRGSWVRDESYLNDFDAAATAWSRQTGNSLPFPTVQFEEPDPNQVILDELPDGTGYVGRRRDYERAVQRQVADRWLRTGNNIRGGLGGAIGYALGGDRGSDLGSAVDGLAMAAAATSAHRQYNQAISQTPPPPQRTTAASPAPARASTPPTTPPPALNPAELIAKTRRYFALPPAPTKSNKRIVGVLVVNGEQMLIHSGEFGGPWGGTHRGNIPRGSGYGFTSGGPSQGNIATHVEGHAAAIMHQQGLRNATLVIEKDPCNICSRNLMNALPAGSTLRVISPSGETLFRSSHYR